MEKMAIEIKSPRRWVHLEIGPQAYEVLDPIFVEGFVRACDPIGLWGRCSNNKPPVSDGVCPLYYINPIRDIRGDVLDRSSPVGI